jgi:hypothetical protein
LSVRRPEGRARHSSQALEKPGVEEIGRDDVPALSRDQPRGVQPVECIVIQLFGSRDDTLHRGKSITLLLEKKQPRSQVLAERTVAFRGFFDQRIETQVGDETSR